MFRFTTFGELALHDCDTQRNRLVQRKGLVLIAVLAVAGKKGMSRERLVALLWPDSLAESGRGALKQTIYELRRAAGNADVVVGTTDLAIDSSLITTDVSEFQSAYSAKNWKRAVEIHRAPFLDAVSVRHAGEFEQWADSHRARFKDMNHRALEQLAIETAELGDFQGAVVWWRTLAAADPFNARNAIGLMNALAAAGNRAGALDHYRVHETLLRDELETGPDEAVTLAAGHIRENERGVSIEPAKSGETDQTSAVVAPPPVIPGVGANGEQFARAAAIGAETRRRALLSLAGGALIVAVGITAVLAATSRDASFGTEPLPVLVVPFENLTGDRSQEGLGLIAADWITEAVVRAHLAPVIEPGRAGAAMSPGHAGAPRALRDIAEGAGVLVTGRVYAQADSLRFTAVVTEVRSGRVLAAFGPLTYSRAEPMRAITSVTDRVVGALARVYDRRLSDLMDSLQPPPRAEAYQHYIKGLFHYARQDQPDSALREFGAAYAIDSGFVTARVWSVWALIAMRRHSDARLLIDSLDVRRSSLSPLHRNAMDAFKAMYAADRNGAIAAAKRAAGIAPQSEWASNQALWTLWENRPREAIKLFKKLDPSRGWLREAGSLYWDNLAIAQHVSGDYDGELATLEGLPTNLNIHLAGLRGLNLAARPGYSATVRYVANIAKSDTISAAFIIGTVVREMAAHHAPHRTPAASAALDSVVTLYRVWLARRGGPLSDPLRYNDGTIMYNAGRLAEAERQFAVLVTEHPGQLVYAGWLARTLARQGDSTRARALLAKFHEEPPYLFKSRTESVLAWRAEVEGWLGHREEATALLAAAFQSGLRHLYERHTWETAFPNLQGYEPFQDLVRSR